MDYIRRLPALDYLYPTTMAEACSLLAEHGEKAALYAGGTDLLPALKRRERSLQYLLSLKNIAGLRDITLTDDGILRIGPLVTIAEIQDSPVIREGFPALSQAADVLASPQIRNMATLAGNICNAAPCADTIPPLVAMGASLKVVSPGGERTLPLEEFFSAPFKTVLNGGELLSAVEIPNQPFNCNGVYLKYTFRGAMDYPFAAIAAALDLDGDHCREARITGSFCSHCWSKDECRYRCPTPFRAIEAEKMLRGNKLNNALLDEAARTASEEAHPIVDREYTREIIRVYTRRALSQSWQKAKRSEG